MTPRALHKLLALTVVCTVVIPAPASGQAPGLVSAGLPAPGPRQFDLEAHRGGLGLVTESTLESFANGLEVGVTTLELDVQITEDRVAVVTHDRQVAVSKCRDTQPAWTD